MNPDHRRRCFRSILLTPGRSWLEAHLPTYSLPWKNSAPIGCGRSFSNRLLALRKRGSVLTSWQVSPKDFFMKFVREYLLPTEALDHPGQRWSLTYIASPITWRKWPTDLKFPLFFWLRANCSSPVVVGVVPETTIEPVCAKSHVNKFGPAYTVGAV